MSEIGDGLIEIHQLAKVDEFIVVERLFSTEPRNASIGLANIHSTVGDVEGNKDKICRALEIFKERNVNIAIFPEFCISGYFWDDEAGCRRYMESARLESQYDWIQSTVKPLLDDNLREVILNGLTMNDDGKFYNTTLVVSEDHDQLLSFNAYQKVFLPGIEKAFTTSGRDNRLVVDGRLGRFGFTTCYDYLFSDLLREYAFEDDVDGIIQTACWRSEATRDYPTLNVRTDQYYGLLWDMVMAASSATHQVWTIACNAVGRHEISGVRFWGGSGIWAPSGMKLVQASNIKEELLIVHNLDIKGERDCETNDFNFAFDFRQKYRPMEGASSVAHVD